MCHIQGKTLTVALSFGPCFVFLPSLVANITAICNTTMTLGKHCIKVTKQHGKLVCHSKMASSMKQILAHDLTIFHKTFDSKKHCSVCFVHSIYLWYCINFRGYVNEIRYSIAE
jgi:hypothetical protein